MSQYICTICGFVYNEADGMPEAGIAPGTRWAELPGDWTCPYCGASKEDFRLNGSAEPAAAAARPVAAQSNADQERSALTVSALCSNLARGCMKQYRDEEAALYQELAAYFKAAAAPANDPSFPRLSESIGLNLDVDFPAAHAAAQGAHDRGALRALTWSEKVTRIQRSLLSRYEKEGEAMLANTFIYVCTICGYIHIGNNPPDICPVCKVPGWKFDKVEGR